MKNTAYISVGSNLKDRIASCKSAVNWLNENGGTLVFAHSRYFETEPVGYIHQPWFVNAVFALKTDLEPFALLKKLQLAQRAHGRNHGRIRFGPRVLDLDILFYNDIILNDAGLVIPHPRIVERRFVLEPLCDIAPDMIHPVFGFSINKLAGALPAGGPRCMPVDGGRFVFTMHKEVKQTF